MASGFSPNETINYAACHDDHCLWDKLQLSAANVPERLRINMDKLAAGIVLTAQGVPFIHAGDEFLRSKNLNKNSYNNNDQLVNPINWSLKARHRDVFDFYQGMILLRHAHPAFRMTSKSNVERAVEVAPIVPRNIVEYVIRDHANGDAWRNVLVIYNGNKEAADLKVTGEWSVVANEKRAGTEILEAAKNLVHVGPFCLTIAHTEGSYRLDPNSVLQAQPR